MGKTQSKSLRLKEKVRKLESERRSFAPVEDKARSELRETLSRLLVALRAEGKIDEAVSTIHKLLDGDNIGLDERATLLLRLSGLERTRALRDGDEAERRRALTESERCASEAAELRKSICSSDPASTQAKEDLAYAKGLLASIEMMMGGKAEQGRRTGLEALELLAQCPVRSDPAQRVLSQGAWKPPFTRVQVKPPKRPTSAMDLKSLDEKIASPATYRLVLVRATAPNAPTGDSALTAQAREVVALYDDESFIELGTQRPEKSLAIGHIYLSLFESAGSTATKEIAKYHALVSRAAPDPSQTEALRWTIFDPNSANGSSTGIRVNGTRITRSILKPGDVVQFGGAKSVKIGEYEARGGRGLTFVVEKSSALSEEDSSSKPSQSMGEGEGGYDLFQKLIAAAYSQHRQSKPSGLTMREMFHRLTLVEGVPRHAWETWCESQAIAQCFA